MPISFSHIASYVGQLLLGGEWYLLTRSHHTFPLPLEETLLVGCCIWPTKRDRAGLPLTFHVHHFLACSELCGCLTRSLNVAAMQVLDENPQQLKQFLSGKTRLQGFFEG
jgi:hypothetical protein